MRCTALIIGVFAALLTLVTATHGSPDCMMPSPVRGMIDVHANFMPCDMDASGPPKQCLVGDCVPNECWVKLAVALPPGVEPLFVPVPSGTICMAATGRCLRGTCMHPDTVLSYPKDILKSDTASTRHAFKPNHLANTTMGSHQECKTWISYYERDYYGNVRTTVSDSLSYYPDGAECAGGTGECFSGQCYEQTSSPFYLHIDPLPTRTRAFP